MAVFIQPLLSESRVDIEYGRAGDYSLRMDVHIPNGPGPFPAIVIVHGGGWVMGDRRHTVQPLFKPLADAGFAWFSISYRLAHRDLTATLGENGISSILMLGTAVDDVRQAITHIKNNADEYRVDPDRVALVGESAGAQLASMAALKPGTAGSVRAVVALYSPMDLLELARTSRQIPDEIRKALEGTVWEKIITTSLRDLSPVTWVTKDSPPFLLIHGTADALVPFSQSEEMQEKMRAAGAICDLFPVRGGGHGIRWWEHERLVEYKRFMVEWLSMQLGVKRT